MLNYAPNSFMGINYASPTVQNMMQNQQQQFQTPYSMSPNFANIGGQGYNTNPFLTVMNNPQYANMMTNGGYYSGYYNYDPQQIRKQMEEEQRRQQEQLRNDINIQKMKAKIYNEYYGLETDEDYLERYYNPNTYVEINKDLNDYEEMRRLSDISNDPNRQVGIDIAAANNISRISNEIRSKHPESQSFLEFLETAGDAYNEALVNENIRNLRKNIANTYDKSAYNQLMNLHRTNSFTSLRQNVSVDDLSISLPEHLRGNKAYQERKNQFLNFITQHDVRNQGGMR